MKTGAALRLFPICGDPELLSTAPREYSGGQSESEIMGRGRNWEKNEYTEIYARYKRHCGQQHRKKNAVK
jgi:hypothetical protein